MTTIRGRLLITLLVGLTIVLAAGFATVYWIAQASLERQFDTGLEARARTVASLVVLEPGRLVYSSEDGPAETLSVTYFELHTQTGELLKRTDNLEGSQLPMLDAVGEEPVFGDVDLPGDVEGRAVWLAFQPRVDLDDEDEHAEDEESEEGEEAMLAAEHMEPEGLVVIAAMDRGRIDMALATILGALVVVGCVLGVTVAVLVTVGVRWGLVPLDRLSSRLGDVGASTISRRIDDQAAPLELVPVYRELNRMLDRVERTIERERLFADAAAHEMRTPLAELRATAEVAIKWPDSERAVAALNETLAIGREMERLVESLLLISRGNASAVNSEAENIPVESVVHGHLEKAAVQISEKRLQIDLGLDQCEPLRAPRDAVQIIIRNLIDNAVQYTPPDGRIAISGSGAADGAPWLIVENGPVDLDENDLPRLFEAFWRTQVSRTDRVHAGLGLAVVEQIARAIGLRVRAAKVEDRLQMRIFTAK